jgi:CubicO group peptidase (beta-lactamase class C family)
MFVIGTLLTLALLAGPPAEDRIDAYVRAEMTRQKIPGLALAVCREGRIVRARGYGLANVELQAPAKPETVFQSGSVGKQFTATAVMMLVEEGKVALEDPITRYFDGAPESWRGITVRHLLTHTSGIKDWGEQEIDYRRDYTEDELVQVAMKMPTDFPPGTQWSYSNTGYVLLGILIHKVSGKFYGDSLQERIFGPLGMKTARIISEADIVPNRAAGYRMEDGKLKNQEWVSPSLNTTADGSLYLTVLDMARWDAALYGESLLKSASLQRMWSPVRLANGTTAPYGFGWSIDEQRGQANIEHGGAWQGFRSHIARYVGSRLSVIVLTNLAGADPGVVAHGVAGLAEPSLQLPDPRKALADPDPTRTAAIRAVLQAYARGEAPPEMAAGLRETTAGTEREKAARKRVGDRLEKMTAFTYAGEDEIAAHKFERRGEAVARIVYYGLVTAGKTYLCRFYLNGKGQVADFAAEER